MHGENRRDARAKRVDGRGRRDTLPRICGRGCVRGGQRTGGENKKTCQGWQECAHFPNIGNCGGGRRMFSIDRCATVTRNAARREWAAGVMFALLFVLAAPFATASAQADTAIIAKALIT